ncbi:hypothetical protein CU254_32440 [Amycolatopsis sp. AA4]|uniref:hypothetical protein n=1 Tax=Actinomycetes TaxID=1760 RepID=UPI0001B55BAF|nr:MULTISPECIES: hypothetical protein [Actinomycetes]ATY14603.1 hypothetical protein CU254_32440 [Amycolatopsis sp. AA4]EFL10716.1 predicted protein [Streptomyces sp. AA4]
MRLRVGAVAVCAALVLAGCGAPAASPTGPFTDLGSLAAAVRQSLGKTGTVRLTMSEESGKGSVDVEVGLLYNDPRTAVDLRMDGGAELRMAGELLFVKPPDAQAKRFGSEGRWIHVFPLASDVYSKAFWKLAKQTAEQTDPLRTVDQLVQAGELTGSEQVELDGRKLTHYRVQLDFERVADHLIGFVADESQDRIRTRLAGKGVRIPLDLWLDDYQRPVKVVLDERPMARFDPGETGSVLTVQYRRWGTPVEVAAPAADKVDDLGG